MNFVLTFWDAGQVNTLVVFPIPDAEERSYAWSDSQANIHHGKDIDKLVHGFGKY
jgi:hypothetical protein